jgi:hypothetical protein
MITSEFTEDTFRDPNYPTWKPVFLLISFYFPRWRGVDSLPRIRRWFLPSKTEHGQAGSYLYVSCASRSDKGTRKLTE